LLLVAQRMAFSPLAAGGTILAVASTPMALSMGATITPDSMAYLGAAAVIAAALMPRTWRSAALATALVSAVAGLTKPNFILIALLGSVLLLLRWTTFERPTISRRTARRLMVIGPASALPTLVSAACSFGWQPWPRHEIPRVSPRMEASTLHSRVPSVQLIGVAQQLSTLLRPDTGTAFSVLDTLCSELSAWS